MAITDILGNAPLWSFIKDQNVKDIITKQEFRVSEEYLHRELVSRAGSEKVRELSLTPQDFLEANNSYGFFERAGGLVKTGPTRTNVMDIRIFLFGGVS